MDVKPPAAVTPKPKKGILPASVKRAPAEAANANAGFIRVPTWLAFTVLGLLAILLVRECARRADAHQTARLDAREAAYARQHDALGRYCDRRPVRALHHTPLPLLLLLLRLVVVPVPLQMPPRALSGSAPSRAATSVQPSAALAAACSVPGRVVVSSTRAVTLTYCALGRRQAWMVTARSSL